MTQGDITVIIIIILSIMLLFIIVFVVMEIITHRRRLIWEIIDTKATIESNGENARFVALVREHKYLRLDIIMSSDSYADYCHIYYLFVGQVVDIKEEEYNFIKEVLL